LSVEMTISSSKMRRPREVNLFCNKKYVHSA